MYSIMSRRECKRRFSPENHRYEYQYVHGGSLFSSAKAFGKQLLGKTAKKAVTKVAEKTAAIPAGGQEIVKLLQQQSQGPSPKKGLTTEERIQRLLRGGRIR